MSEKHHPGITMHKLSFGGGFVGLLFAAGSALIFVLGFPTLWYFVAFAVALGIAIAAFLGLTSSRISERNKPLSILPAQQTAQNPIPGGQTQHRHLFHLLPEQSAV
ncbi:MAG: hypothetical protein ACRD3B_02590 [Candidatus Sulfotelmatobacter sp.]